MEQAGTEEAKAAQWPDAAPLSQIIPTVRHDAGLVIETQDTLEQFGDLTLDVLLLGGELSAPYLTSTLDALEGVLPNSHRVELAGCDHVAAENGGQPELVAAELRRFFT
jgi:hypothetical protein